MSKKPESSNGITGPVSITAEYFKFSGVSHLETSLENLSSDVGFWSSYSRVVQELSHLPSDINYIQKCCDSLLEGCVLLLLFGTVLHKERASFRKETSESRFKSTGYCSIKIVRFVFDVNRKRRFWLCIELSYYKTSWVRRWKFVLPGVQMGHFGV
jgi:hypothetical protein